MKKYTKKLITILLAFIYLASVTLLYPEIGNTYIMLSIIPIMVISWVFGISYALIFQVLCLVHLYIAIPILNIDPKNLLDLNFIIGTIISIVIIVGMHVFKRTISRLNTVESDLKTHMAKKNDMISNISDVIAIMNEQGIITYKSPNVEKLFGWQPDELIGKPGWHNVHPDDVKRIKHEFSGSISQQDKTTTHEFLYRCKNGDYKNIILYAKNLLHNPNINGILINYRDITEKKQAKLALEENEYKYRTLFENSKDIVCMLDVDGEIIDINDAGTELFGYSKEEFLKLNVKQLLHPDDREKSRIYFEKLENEGAYSMYEGRIITKLGEVKWIQVNSTAFEKDGKKIGSQDIIRDITLQKEAEDKLKALNTTKDKLFSIVSHDLRNPFSSISGFSELIMNKIENNSIEDIGEFAKLIHQSASQSERLLSNLLDWSRSQTGSLHFNPEKNILLDMVQEEILLLKNTALNKKIDISTSIPKDQIIIADKNMIATVIRNLISNSIKFTHPGGSISIYSSETKTELTFSISDTGVGMLPEESAKLFNLKHNLSKTGTENEKGSGLGLVLCKEFIDMHKGKIWVESEINKGSTFFISLPKKT